MTTISFTWLTMEIGGVLLMDPFTTTLVVGGVIIVIGWLGYKAYQSIKNTAEAAKKKREDLEKENKSGN